MSAFIAGVEPSLITHKELVREARRWLSTSQSYTVAVAELVTTNQTGEIPDALAFKCGGYSALIECKASRSDFLADKTKPFRQSPDLGMGQRRFYMAPKGMLSPDEVGAWGLIEVTRTGGRLFSRMKKDSEPFIANKLAEVGFLTSVIRRLEISTAVFVSPEIQDQLGGAQ